MNNIQLIRPTKPITLLLLGFSLLANYAFAFTSAFFYLYGYAIDVFQLKFHEINSHSTNLPPAGRVSSGIVGPIIL